MIPPNHRHAEGLVQRDGRSVVTRHVQHALAKTPMGEMRKSGDGERTTNSATMEGGVDADDVDLTDRSSVGVIVGV